MSQQQNQLTTRISGFQLLVGTNDETKKSDILLNDLKLKKISSEAGLYVLGNFS